MQAPVPTSAPTPEPKGWARLRTLVAKVERHGPGSLAEAELEELPRLYRQASTQLAQLETRATDAARIEEARAVVLDAHRILYREAAPARGGVLLAAARFLLVRSPRAIRAEWRLLALLLALFYGLGILAYVLVRHDLELAFSLMGSEPVAQQIEQLRATEQGEPFRGNFTFGVELAAPISGYILAHNMTVALLFFGSALVPPLFLVLLAVNALMVGTYTGVAAHWGQAGAISSILWSHGVLELQMIVLSGAAGLALVRGWLLPGPWSRARALELGARRAWELFAPTFPGLFLAGIIEGYVSPHAGLGVRSAVAVSTGILLALWVTLGGRGGAAEGQAAPPRS